MKLFTLIFATLILTKSCQNELEKDSVFISFEYEMASRGSYYKIIAKHDSVISIHDRAMKSVTQKTIKISDWNKLLTLLDKIDKDNIHNIKAPSTKHHFDAAMAANLKIIHKNKTYEIKNFDHGNPPKEVEAIVLKLLAISDFKNP
jgi:hypothetical protein